jgi:hypothetical protein
MPLRSCQFTLLLALVLNPAASAQQKEILGTLQALDAKVGTIAISQPPLGNEKTFSLLNKDIPVTNSLGARLKLTDLKKHHRLVLTIANDEDVLAIRLESDLDWGVLTGVDAARNELMANMSHTPRPLKITPKMRVWIDGKIGSAANLKELKPWSHGVKVLLTPDRSEIQEMWINRGKYHTNPYCRRIAVAGFLVRHDPVKQNLALITTERYQQMEFTYDSWTQLQLVHHFQTLRNVPISKLTSPCKVQIGYDSDTKRAGVIKLELPTISRREVAAIDPETRKLSLAAAEESPAEVFFVAADAKIVRDGKEPSKLADVKANYVVSVGLSPDQKEVLYLSFSAR